MAFFTCMIMVRAALCTTADRKCRGVCHSSSGRSQIWKIMEMYLCRRRFISIWALWEIKISLCLWEERGWGGEGVWMCVEIGMRMKFFLNLCISGVFVHRVWHLFWTRTNVPKWQADARRLTVKSNISSSCLSPSSCSFIAASVTKNPQSEPMYENRLSFTWNCTGFHSPSSASWTINTRNPQIKLLLRVAQLYKLL